MRLVCIALVLQLAPVWAGTPATHREAHLYRYKNDKGVTAVDDHVPPEFVKNGYDILTRDMRVIETVPRQLTGEEGTRQREAAEQARKNEQWDKRLLLRYSNVADIEEARDRALAEFDVRLSILQTNLRSTKARIEEEQAHAADLERRGQNVPDATTRNIAELKKEIATMEDSVAQRHREKEETRLSYERDIERFKMLSPLVEMRRQSSGDKSGQ